MIGIATLLQHALSIMIHASATKYELDPEIVAGVIYQESVGGSRTLLSACFAMRYEEGFYRNYVKDKPLTGVVPEGIHVDSEKHGRSISWGLMQVMGATARENGFDEKFFPLLLLPWNNIEIGCRYLAKCLSRSENGYFDALRMYNGSLKNPKTAHYAEKVLAHVDEGRISAILTKTGAK